MFQVTLLFKHWSEFSDVIIEFGTMKSPQCKISMLDKSNYQIISPQIRLSWSPAFSPLWSWQSLPESVTFFAR